MTDKELRDAAVAALKLTTAGWRKSNGQPNYPSGTAPATTHWGKAMSALEQIGQVVEPPPPPTGSVIDVSPGTFLTKIAAAAAGDTVRLVGGQHSYTVLNRSFGEPRLTIACEAGSSIVGVDTGAQSGYIFDATFKAERPAEFSNYDISCFYIHGPSTRIRLSGTLRGGGVTLKVYCGGGQWAEHIEVIDADISLGGIDLSHWNGARYVTIEHNRIHDPTFRSGSHQDAIQAVRLRSFIIARNTITAPNIAGGNSQGMMLGSTVQYGESRSLIDGVIVNNLVHHWNENKPLLLTCCDNVKVVNNTFQDHGNAYNSLTVTAVHGPVSNIEVFNNIMARMYAEGGVSLCDTNWFTYQTYGANAKSGDPGFVDRATYELTASSSARTFGLLRANTPTMDLDGTARSVPVGLGCRI